MYDSLTSKITRVSKLKNWDAQKQGIYRYSDDNGIRFSGSQYEILILHYEENSDILTAKAMLFFIEDPFWKRGSFNRKVLLTGTVSDCLEKAGEVLMSQNTSKETLEYSFFASLGFERMESPKGEAGYTKTLSRWIRAYRTDEKGFNEHLPLASRIKNSGKSFIR